MVQPVPPPDAEAILPPILACLPIAFVSSQPPPALLPLLSPILRQRVQLLSATSSSRESWLPLLCWDSASGQRLVEMVSKSDAFEVHPTSGEVEMGIIEPVTYRRTDEETLQARVLAPDVHLVLILLWCMVEGPEEEPGWKISEVKPYMHEAASTDTAWQRSISEAEEKGQQRINIPVIGNGNGTPQNATSNGVVDDDDDDDYWARYDKTPGRTPGQGHSPAPEPPAARHARTASEAEYFERYAQVQPEMDNDNPSRDKGDIGESTLNGNVFAPEQKATEDQTSSLPNRSVQAPAAPNLGQGDVASQRQTSEDSVTDVVVRQHVSASLKSLYRLCRRTGMEAEEFSDVVNTEMQALSMLDLED